MEDDWPLTATRRHWWKLIIRQELGHCCHWAICAADACPAIPVSQIAKHDEVSRTIIYNGALRKCHVSH